MNLIEKNFLCPLSHLGFIFAQGADADSFLQGQLSNDIRLLTGERAQISSYNSPKGRMLAVLNLTRTDAGILIQLERSVLEATLKRLKMFVLRAKVTLADVSDPISALGLYGPEAGQTLAEAGLAAPAAINDCSRHGALCVLRQHGETPRFVVQGPAIDIKMLQNKLSARIPSASTDTWRRLEIMAGVPAVFPQTSDHFVPQMTNLDQLGGISFTKGCYTGQEIVARLHYLGNLKRRMFYCRAQASGIEPGVSVHDANSEQAVGEVAQVANADDGCLLSVVLQLTHAQSEQLRLGSPNGPPLSRPHSSIAEMHGPAVA